MFYSKLEAQGGNPTMKKNSLAELMELKGSYDLCGIWRVRNTKSKRFTFAQKKSSGFIQRRLDYMFISNTPQEFVIMTEIMTAIYQTILLYSSIFQKKSPVSKVKDFGNAIAP